mmetsp:Transcript_13074/g.30428  ORF Transcript_13074/g.30428 Transcript_13074/m.30428 type:complete len:251 (+) Transcript_13074:899-1651(+)
MDGHWLWELSAHELALEHREQNSQQKRRDSIKAAIAETLCSLWGGSAKEDNRNLHQRRSKTRHQQRVQPSYHWLLSFLLPFFFLLPFAHPLSMVQLDGSAKFRWQHFLREFVLFQLLHKLFVCSTMHRHALFDTIRKESPNDGPDSCKDSGWFANEYFGDPQGDTSLERVGDHTIQFEIEFRRLGVLWIGHKDDSQLLGSFVLDGGMQHIPNRTNQTLPFVQAPVQFFTVDKQNISPSRILASHKLHVSN